MVYASPWPRLDIPKCNILSYLFPPGSSPANKKIWIDAADPSISLSPAQMLSWVRRLAVGLEKRGIPRSTTIMVFSPNQIFVPVIYLAAAGSRRYFTGANPAYTAHEVAYQMKAVDASIVLIAPSLLETGIAAAKIANLPLSRLFVFSDAPQCQPQNIDNWQSLLASEEDSCSWQWDSLDGELSTTTTAVINFSSGTTGLPKGVCISHHNLVANTAQVIYSEAKGRGAERLSSERWLAFLPLYHAYSQLFTINVALKVHAEVYIVSTFSLKAYLESIQRFKITTLQLVPPVLIMMAKRPEAATYDVGSLKYVSSGAAPLSSDIQNEIESRFGITVRQGWGMTETTCAGIMTPSAEENVAGSIGYLLPNSEARLVDEHGQDSKPGEPGELWIRGPQIMIGYWTNVAATTQSMTSDGWFKTGDVAVTRDNYWWIVDRQKELIKVNGLQVAPAELEAVLLEHQDVADAAAVEISIHGEELPRAYVVRQDGAQISVGDLQAFVARKLAKHKRLQGGVKFVQEIPKLPSGKIVRKVIKEWSRRDAGEIANSVMKSRL